MQLNRGRIGQILLISLSAAFMASGCASFAGRELPTHTNEQLLNPEKKIFASYDVKAFGPHGENSIAASKLDKEIQKVLSAGPLFAELKSGSAQGDYHYSFVFHNEGRPPEVIAFLNGFISGLTLGVIPAYGRDIFIMTVDVKQNDHVLKTYTYTDHMDSWIQLLLVFLTPFNWPPSVASSIIDNMIINFAHDFSNDVRSGVYLVQQNKN
ncbi:MAG TPA: hypothetical protein VEM40_06525 [Nitrospirota bacterium]|nr:hypothetical protein [Nitrospirota bacterium]